MPEENTYLKPQTPLNIGNQYFYPLTTDDQVIMSDGTRLSDMQIKSPVYIVGSSEEFPEIGDSGIIYIRDGYLYLWDGSGYHIISVQSVNGKTGQIVLTASDVNALESPSAEDIGSGQAGDYLVVKEIVAGKIIVGISSLELATQGFIEMDTNLGTEQRAVNTLYGLKLRVLDEAAVIGYNN